MHKVLLLLYSISVGWGVSDHSRDFGGAQPGVKAQILNIVHSTRTVMRSELHFDR